MRAPSSLSLSLSQIHTHTRSLTRSRTLSRPPLPIFYLSHLHILPFTASLPHTHVHALQHHPAHTHSLTNSSLIPGNNIWSVSLKQWRKQASKRGLWRWKKRYNRTFYFNWWFVEVDGFFWSKETNSNFEVLVHRYLKKNIEPKFRCLWRKAENWKVKVFRWSFVPSSSSSSCRRLLFESNVHRWWLCELTYIVTNFALER